MKILKIVFLTLFLTSSGPLIAGEIGHYAPGLLNIRDFFVPEPGLYAAVYNFFYTTGTFKDQNGNSVNSITFNPGPGSGVTVNVDADVDVFVVVPTLMWITPAKILGARYGLFISPTFGNTNIAAALSTETRSGQRTNESQFDVGDMFVQPVWLGWPLEHWDFEFSYGFYAPTGKYNVQTINLSGATIKSPAADNVGLGFWTHQLQVGGAWYPWKHRGTAVMGTVTGEIHQNKDGFDLTPGSHITWNWGISQFLPVTKSKNLFVELGLLGYSQWQISDDTGADAENGDIHDQVHAIGGQLGLTYIPWKFFITSHYLHELGVEDRFEGDSVTLAIGKKFL